MENIEKIKIAEVIRYTWHASNGVKCKGHPSKKKLIYKFHVTKWKIITIQFILFSIRDEIIIC